MLRLIARPSPVPPLLTEIGRIDLPKALEDRLELVAGIPDHGPPP